MFKRRILFVISILTMIAFVGCTPSSTAESSLTIQMTTVETTASESTTEETTIETTVEETTIETTVETEAITEETTAETTAKTYILNTNTKKIHSSDCSSVKKIKDKNKAETTKTIEELESEGYEVCQICYAI